MFLTHHYLRPEYFVLGLWSMDWCHGLHLGTVGTVECPITVMSPRCSADSSADPGAPLLVGGGLCQCEP